MVAAFGKLEGLRMLELGDQVCESKHPEPTGKAYYSNRGVLHTSFDLNGLNGSIKVNISKPFARKWLGVFDVVTNAGTLEHVEPLSYQHPAFKNVHDALRPGGIAIHLVPDAHELDERGAWKGHCGNYYDRAFFELIAKQSGSTLLRHEIIRGLSCACIRRDAAPFMADKAALAGAIHRREGGAIYPGINDLPVITRPWRKFKHALIPHVRRWVGKA